MSAQRLWRSPAARSAVRCRAELCRKCTMYPFIITTLDLDDVDGRRRSKATRSAGRGHDPVHAPELVRRDTLDAEATDEHLLC